MGDSLQAAKNTSQL
ncbi:hypothetical protein D041_4117A, partial [Vibrio parahaemolyticus EKP-008]